MFKTLTIFLSTYNAKFLICNSNYPDNEHEDITNGSYILTSHSSSTNLEDQQNFDLCSISFKFKCKLEHKPHILVAENTDKKGTCIQSDNFESESCKFNKRKDSHCSQPLNSFPSNQCLHQYIHENFTGDFFSIQFNSTKYLNHVFNLPDRLKVNDRRLSLELSTSDYADDSECSKPRQASARNQPAGRTTPSESLNWLYFSMLITILIIAAIIILIVLHFKNKSSRTKEKIIDNLKKNQLLRDSYTTECVEKNWSKMKKDLQSSSEKGYIRHSSTESPMVPLIEKIDNKLTASSPNIEASEPVIVFKKRTHRRSGSYDAKIEEMKLDFSEPKPRQRLNSKFGNLSTLHSCGSEQEFDLKSVSNNSLNDLDKVTPRTSRTSAKIPRTINEDITTELPISPENIKLSDEGLTTTELKLENMLLNARNLESSLSEFFEQSN